MNKLKYFCFLKIGDYEISCGATTVDGLFEFIKEHLSQLKTPLIVTGKIHET
jgi:hypothetical protein